MNKHKLLKKVLTSSKNVRFGDMVTLVEAFGFTLVRVNGSHHIFERTDVPEIISLQERKGKAIPQHNLQLGEGE